MESIESIRDDSIQVFVRVKPGCQQTPIVVTGNQIRLQKHQFGFDKIFPSSAQQDDIFQSVGKKLITHTLDGYNGCIFVYGQTGSGKTYTMIGDSNGLMQKSFAQLFTKIDRMGTTQCVMTCSYYELYNEQIIDLLDPKKDKKSLNIRHDIKKGVFVQNLTEEVALNSGKLMECLNMGMKNRHIGQTLMNRQSSRSHSIFTLSLSIKSQVEGKQVLKTPKLHFVDLAGSQRQKMTMASGDRLKEAGNINKSLTTLGMVINALASQKVRSHIPYRDSKLTTLLRDSLGGNSKTFIVATISTSVLCFQETLSTLNFANRAKMVKVKALVNQQSLSTNIQHYKEQIRRLKTQILRIKSQRRMNFDNGPSSQFKTADIEHHFEQINNKISLISQHLRNGICSPTFESMIANISAKKSLNNSQCKSAMKDEGQQKIDPQAGDVELIDYLNSNYELLSQINKKVNEYVAIKDDLRNISFSNKLAIEDIKTPSKFERDQYEQMLNKREEQIKQLEQSLSALREQYSTKDIELKEFKRRGSASKKEQSDQIQGDISRLKQQLAEAYTKIDRVSAKCQSSLQDKRRLEKANEDLQARINEVKELHIYSQQKYQNQKYSRIRIEQHLKELNIKLSLLEEERKMRLQESASVMEQLRGKLEDYESRQEQLKNQIQVLVETSEFNQRLIVQFDARIQQFKKQLGQMLRSRNQNMEQINRLYRDYDGLKFQSTNQSNEFRKTEQQLRRAIANLERSNAKQELSQSEIRLQFQAYREKMEGSCAEIQQQYRRLKESHMKMLADFQQAKINNRRQLSQYEGQLYKLKTSLGLSQQQKEVAEKQNVTARTMLAKEREDHQEQMSRMNKQITNMHSDLAKLSQESMKKDRVAQEMQKLIDSRKNIAEEHQQLRKIYKQVVKQNYKLKGQYSVGSSSTIGETQKNQELASKVSYYEQKFRLMSMEYHKATEAIKKMKAKEINLLKKIQYFEQNEKIKKISLVDEEQQIALQRANSLKLENSELKDEVARLSGLLGYLDKNIEKDQRLKKMNVETEKQQLGQRQSRIRKRLEASIKHWGDAKQNNCAGKSLEELFVSWEKIEADVRKKYQGIESRIKRQKELKSQNNFILKQNFYLKEKIDALERSQISQSSGHPRKLIKTNQLNM